MNMKLMSTSSSSVFYLVSLCVVLFLQSTLASGQTLQYNHEYTCNGEKVVVGHCRRDDDTFNMPRTTDAENYRMVFYPDRPKQGGFTVQRVELKSEIIKKLQACGAFSSDGPTANGDNFSRSSVDDDIARAEKLVQDGHDDRAKGLEDHAALDFALAVAKYKEALARNSNNTKALVGLGGVYMNDLRDYGNALAVWAKLRKLEQIGRASC